MFSLVVITCISLVPSSHGIYNFLKPVVRPFVRPSVRPSVCPSVRLSQGEVVLGAGPAEVREAEHLFVCLLAVHVAQTLASEMQVKATVGAWPARYDRHAIDALQMILRPFDGRWVGSAAATA